MDRQFAKWTHTRVDNVAGWPGCGLSYVPQLQKSKLLVPRKPSIVVEEAGQLKRVAIGAVQYLSDLAIAAFSETMSCKTLQRLLETNGLTASDLCFTLGTETSIVCIEACYIRTSEWVRQNAPRAPFRLMV